MFTGIIEKTVSVLAADHSDRGRQLSLGYGNESDPLKLGESVALNGVCLTVSKLTEASFEVDVIQETLESTTLGHLRAGDPLNMERSLRMGDRIGGHFVFGHVDGTAVIRKIVRTAEHVLWAVDYPAGTKRFIAEKGSVALDGVSLTIQETHENVFMVALIPHTLLATNLGKKREGDLVNVETDMWARYAQQAQAGEPPFPFTVEQLKQLGF